MAKKFSILIILSFLFICANYAYGQVYRYNIYLKNGKNFKVNGYWEEGEQICYERFGGTICTERESVLRIEKQEITLEEVLENYKKTLCSYFMNNIKLSLSFKKEGVKYEDALNKHNAMVQEIIKGENDQKIALRIAEDACKIAYSLPKDVINIENPYFDKCMRECKVAWENDRFVLLSFVNTQNIKTEPVTIPRGTESITYHGNTQSHVFHRPGCRYYNCKNCTAVFRSREEAINAGYKPCGVCSP